MTGTVLGPKACFVTASSAPLVAPGQATGWGESGGLWTPTCSDPLPGCVRARPSDTHIPGCSEGVAGAAFLVPASGEVMGRILALLDVGLGNGDRLCYPRGLGPVSTQEFYLPSFSLHF